MATSVYLHLPVRIQHGRRGAGKVRAEIDAQVTTLLVEMFIGRGKSACAPVLYFRELGLEPLNNDEKCIVGIFTVSRDSGGEIFN
jgi:hypothetical protein